MSKSCRIIPVFRYTDGDSSLPSNCEHVTIHVQRFNLIKCFVILLFIIHPLPNYIAVKASSLSTDTSKRKPVTHPCDRGFLFFDSFDPVTVMQSNKQ